MSTKKRELPLSFILIFQVLCSFDYLNYSIVLSMVNLLITLNFVIKFSYVYQQCLQIKSLNLQFVDIAF